MSTSYAAAAIVAVTCAALHAGHWLGDHPVQSNVDANAKGAPAPGAGHPWAGWGHIARHVATYTATQAVCLALVALVAPVTLVGSLAALAVSAATHAVIDRRWLVAWVMDAKAAQAWREGYYLTDQSLHHGAIFLAAITAALATTLTGLAVVAAAGAALVAAALAVEQYRDAHAPDFMYRED
jgi:hypothetical protein